MSATAHKQRVIMFENWTLKKRLTLTFATILLIAVVLFSVAVVNIGKMREATGWNTHTYKVLAEGRGMLISMVNIETGLRGFVASGDEKFLEPLKAGQEEFKTNFDNAKKLTSDNAAQQARLDKMQDHHKQFMEVATSLMALRRDVNSGKSTAEDLLRDFRAGRDKASMDAFPRRRGRVHESRSRPPGQALGRTRQHQHPHHVRAGLRWPDHVHPGGGDHRTRALAHPQRVPATGWRTRRCQRSWWVTWPRVT